MTPSESPVNDTAALGRKDDQHDSRRRFTEQEVKANQRRPLSQRVRRRPDKVLMWAAQEERSGDGAFRATRQLGHLCSCQISQQGHKRPSPHPFHPINSRSLSVFL